MPTHNRLYIAGSFFLALLFSAYPIGFDLQWYRPDWVLLVLVYWVLHAPEAVGVATGFVAGLALDFVQGAVPGQNALAFVLVAYFVAVSYQRLRMASQLQLALTVFFLSLLHIVIVLWVQNIAGNALNSMRWLWIPVITAVMAIPANAILALGDRGSSQL